MIFLSKTLQLSDSSWSAFCYSHPIDPLLNIACILSVQEVSKTFTHSRFSSMLSLSRQWSGIGADYQLFPSHFLIWSWYWFHICCFIRVLGFMTMFTRPKKCPLLIEFNQVRMIGFLVEFVWTSAYTHAI